MKALTIPFHLLIPTVVSLTGLLFMLVKRNTLKPKNSLLYKSGLIFLFAYALIVGNALGHNLYYQWDLNKHDFNQNGLFESPTETTPNQKLAVERLINNAGRNYAVISGLIVSGVLSASIFLLMKIRNLFLGSEEHENKNNQFNNAHI